MGKTRRLVVFRAKTYIRRQSLSKSVPYLPNAKFYTINHDQNGRIILYTLRAPRRSRPQRYSLSTFVHSSNHYHANATDVLGNVNVRRVESSKHSSITSSQTPCHVFPAEDSAMASKGKSLSCTSEDSATLKSNT
jgi:hypothetical protein